MSKTSEQFKDKAEPEKDTELDPDSWDYAIMKIEEGLRIETEEVKKFIEEGDRLFGKPKVPDELNDPRYFEFE